MLKKFLGGLKNACKEYKKTLYFFALQNICRQSILGRPNSLMTTGIGRPVKIGTNRKFFIAIICQAALFLVFLGVRNPVLGSSPSPKPRPMAVIEDSVKSAQEDGVELQLDIEHCLQYSITSYEPHVSSIIHEVHPCAFDSAVLLSSRAPPRYPNPLFF
jgi:hypothetical protein